MTKKYVIQEEPSTDITRLKKERFLNSIIKKERKMTLVPTMLSPNYSMQELCVNFDDIRKGNEQVATNRYAIENLSRLCNLILEPITERIEHKLDILQGWRPTGLASIGRQVFIRSSIVSPAKLALVGLSAFVPVSHFHLWKQGFDLHSGMLEIWLRTKHKQANQIITMRDKRNRLSMLNVIDLSRLERCSRKVSTFNNGKHYANRTGKSSRLL